MGGSRHYMIKKMFPIFLDHFNIVYFFKKIWGFLFELIDFGPYSKKGLEQLLKHLLQASAWDLLKSLLKMVFYEQTWQELQIDQISSST